MGIVDVVTVPLIDEAKALEPQLKAARETETRLTVIREALSRAQATLVTGQNAGLQTLKTLDEADRAIKRFAEMIMELEATLPQGILEEKRAAEQELQSYRQERKEEENKENTLRNQIGQRQGAMNANTEARKKAGRQAWEAFPAFARRQVHHTPALGLERFVGRARVLYQAERATHANTAELRLHFEKLTRERSTSQRSAFTRLLTGIQAYVEANPDQHPGFEWTGLIEVERTPTLHDWISLRHRHLSDTVLRNFKDQVDRAVTALVEAMVHDFLSKLRANIDAVERIKEDLNRELRGSVFMGEVYQIRQERDESKDVIRYLVDRLDIVAPKASALIQGHVDPQDPDQAKIKAMIEMLTDESGDDANHRRYLREISDYRNYFRFHIDICDPEQSYRKLSDLEQRRGKASGGQKFVPFYICLGVAAATAYYNHLAGSRDAPPQSAVMLMDEAFEKLDPDNIYKVIQFYQKLGLQLIMAAPKTHQALYQETFDTIISIIRAGRAIKATAQHFHPPGQALLWAENPMHKPRSYFEQEAQRDNAAQ